MATAGVDFRRSVSRTSGRNKSKSTASFRPSELSGRLPGESIQKQNSHTRHDKRGRVNRETIPRSCVQDTRGNESVSPTRVANRPETPFSQLPPPSAFDAGTATLRRRSVTPPRCAVQHDATQKLSFLNSCPGQLFSTAVDRVYFRRFQGPRFWLTRGIPKIFLGVP